MMTSVQKWLERGWKPIVGGGMALFVIWFVVNEAGGFATLGEFLLGALRVVPDALTFIVEYYRELPTDQLSGSLLLGGAIGAVLTICVYLGAYGWVKFPRPTTTKAIAGLIIGFIYFQIGAYFFDALLLSIAVTVVLAFILQDDDKRLFSRRTLRSLLSPIPLRLIGTGALLGGIVGMIGAQLLNYPSQHCTLSSEADLATQQAGLVLTAIGAVVLLLPFWTVMLQRGKRQEHGGGYFKGWVMPFALLMPSLISLVVFLYYPSVQVAVQSMTRQRGRQPVRFVCLENYADLLADTVYLSSFVTTFFITIGIVLFSMALGLMIALLASQKIRGASVYRTLLIWPYAVSPVVTAVIFIAIFRNDPNGFANYYLGGILGGAQNWIGNANLAPLVIILASVWNALGFNILFYVAGLQNVPKDLLEAAQIDGANVAQRFIRITFPLLSPFTFFLLIANITFGVYGLYGIIDTLTQGGPPIGDGAGATNILIYKLYADLLSTGSQMGNVAAQSVLLFTLVAIITIVQFQFVERRVTYSE